MTDDTPTERVEKPAKSNRKKIAVLLASISPGKPLTHAQVNDLRRILLEVMDVLS